MNTANAFPCLQVFIFVVSEESACSNFCEDTVSFAYISNTPIIPIALQKEDVLEAFLNAGLRLTLRSMKWYLFEEKSKHKEAIHEVEEVIKESIDHVKKEESKPKNEQQATIRIADLDLGAPTATKADVRLERAAPTDEEKEKGSGQFQTFWEISFGDQEEVAWFRFQEAFLEHYKSDLKRMFTDDSTQWLLKLLEREVFEGQNQATKRQFMKFRGDTPVKHEFWRRVSRLAIESYNMHQVFDMDSSVRLAAVENLSKFSSRAVIQALIKLLDDADPNIRAVAAISLARTEVTNDQIVSKLIASLRDGDRLVRESGCLALGHMKAERAVSAVVSLWYVFTCLVYHYWSTLCFVVGEMMLYHMSVQLLRWHCQILVVRKLIKPFT
jgi:hypothetical protein